MGSGARRQPAGPETRRYIGTRTIGNQETAQAIAPCVRNSRAAHQLSAHTQGLRHRIDDRRGEIDAGDSTLPLCEAELELKRGNRACLFEFARTIARATSGELAVKSKSQRGYELLAGEDAAVARGEAVDVAPDMPASAAFRSIGFACLKQIVANKPAILAGNPEGIHQMRIGLRRLRAAISLFSDIGAEAEVRDIKWELKWLTSELAPAREFDLFLTRVVAPLEKSHARLTGMRSLSHDLADRRDAAVARALTAVGSQRFRDLTLNLAAWLDVGGW